MIYKNGTNKQKMDNKPTETFLEKPKRDINCLTTSPGQYID